MVLTCHRWSSHVTDRAPTVTDGSCLSPTVLTFTDADPISPVTDGAPDPGSENVSDPEDRVNYERSPSVFARPVILRGRETHLTILRGGETHLTNGCYGSQQTRPFCEET